MILSIDASNIGSGGGINHLIELLSHANPGQYGFNNVIIWGSSSLLQQLPAKNWLEKREVGLLDRSIFHRVFWQTFIRDGEVKKAAADILFLPNSSISSFHPQVSMCQNQLPFEEEEMKLYKGTSVFFRLKLLRMQHEKSYRSADGMIFLSNYSLDGVARSIAGIEKKAAIIPHGINNIFFNTNKQDKEPETLELVYVSIIDVYKHQWNVVKTVINLVNKGYKNIRLTLIGGCFEPAMKKLEAVLKAHPEAHEYISYIGKLNYNDLPALYSKADIGVFASSCETFGMILLEKMAAGLPIASSQMAAAKEIAGESAIYFDPYDVDSITNALEKLLKSSDLKEQLSKKAQERARNFSWEKCAHETFNYLQTVKLQYDKCAESPAG